MLARRSILLALALAALAFAACITTPPPPPPKPADPCALAAPAQVWLRGGEILQAPSGAVAADVWNPLAVDLLPDGRIRARDTKGDFIEGYAPELKGSAAGEERGLGVYVQQEAPITLTRGGPEVGRVFPGAYLPVVAMDACQAEVLLRGPGSPVSPPLKVLLPVAAVGVKELSPSAPPRAPRHVRDHKRKLLAEPGVAASAFAETRCGRLEVLDSRQDPNGVEVQLVSQSEQQGVELRGWVDRPIAEARGEDRCPVRVLDKKQVVGFDGEGSLPEGYAAFGDGEALGKELEKLAKKDRPVYIPLLDGERVRCEAFRLRAKGTELIRADQERVKRPAQLWQVRIGQGRLSLSGPCRGGGSCSTQYLLVGLTSGRLALLPERDGLGARARDLVGYHQDDTEPWFFDRAECEAQGGVDRASMVLPLP